MNNEDLKIIPNNLELYTDNYSSTPYKQLGWSINLFCNTNNPLKGNAWDKFKSKLSSLNVEIGILQSYSSLLNELINEASNEINGILGTYNGNIKIPEHIYYAKEFYKIDSTIASLEAEIRGLEKNLYKTIIIGYSDKEKTKPIYDQAFDERVNYEIKLKRKEKLDWENYKEFINSLYRLYQKYSEKCGELCQKFGELNERLFEYIK